MGAKFDFIFLEPNKNFQKPPASGNIFVSHTSPTSRGRAGFRHLLHHHLLGQEEPRPGKLSFEEPPGRPYVETSP